MGPPSASMTTTLSPVVWLAMVHHRPASIIKLINAREPLAGAVADGRKACHSLQTVRKVALAAGTMVHTRPGDQVDLVVGDLVLPPWGRCVIKVATGDLQQRLHVMNATAGSTGQQGGYFNSPISIP